MTGIWWSIYSSVQHGHISHKYSQKTPHSSPVRASYGVSIVDQACDCYSASVPVIIYVIWHSTVCVTTLKYVIHLWMHCF